MAAPEIAKIQEPEDIDRAIATLVLAFSTDPAARWMYRSAARYLTHFGPFVRAFAGRAFAAGTAYGTDDGAGAALWLPPGVPVDEAALAAVLDHTLPAEKISAFVTVFEQTAQHHPHEPHWYLPLIGTDPCRRGTGLGAALLQHTLRHCDRDRAAAYLECTNPANIGFYQRHGFEVRATIAVDASFSIVPMLRPARRS